MGKYDQLLAPIKGNLASVQNILIALPVQVDGDKLGAGLALYLSLKQAGKTVYIVSEGTLKVEHSNFFGVGEVRNQFPQVTGGGDLIISLEGVVDPNTTDKSRAVPTLETLDWYPEGNNLNLVFHPVPGQRFEPLKITPKYPSSNLDLVFVIGVASLEFLGDIYLQNKQSFSSAQVVNIDNNSGNLNYGQVNLVDSQAGSLSEMMAQIISALGLRMDQDTATNILSGIYITTNNLTTNIKPDTLFAAGFAMQAGGRVPGGGVTQPIVSPAVTPVASPQVQNQQFDYRQFIQPNTPQPQSPLSTLPTTTPLSPSTTSPILSSPTESFTVPLVVNNPPPPSSQAAFQTHEEKPSGEFTSSGSVESPEVLPAPDWLTPKIYKGGGLG